MSGDNDWMNDGSPSPWWPCPNCGHDRFTVTCQWERGRFDPEIDEWTDLDMTGTPQGISTLSTCLNCGHAVDLSKHYQWSVQS